MDVAPHDPENPTVMIAESLFRRELQKGGEDLAAIFRAMQTLDWARREWGLVRRWRMLDPETQRAIECVVERLTTPPPFDAH